LEAICFAILIGISCDFVIHFGHAYAFLPGDVDRHERTKHALIAMGPSILAAAFTTICAAAVMIFTVITFFQKFAIILFYTILNATIGSFIVFITLTDTLGPTHPTYLFDQCMLRLCGKQTDASMKDETNETALTDSKIGFEETPPPEDYEAQRMKELAEEVGEA
jgi:predicted exporter